MADDQQPDRAPDSEKVRTLAYKDAIQPAAQEFGAAAQRGGAEFGKAFTTLGRAVHAALSTIQPLVWCFEQVAAFVADQTEKRFASKPEKLITPSPVVAVPALQAMSYTASSPTLREMYMNLLAASMDKDTAKHAHPAFVEIIKQLTPDEARILGLLHKKSALPLVSLVERHRREPDSTTMVFPHFSIIFEQVECEHVELMESYFDNLCRAGLAAIPDSQLLTAPGLYEPLLDHPLFRTIREGCQPEGEYGVVEPVRGLIEITAFGRQFCDTCIVEAKADSQSAAPTPSAPPVAS